MPLDLSLSRRDLMRTAAALPLAAAGASAAAVDSAYGFHLGIASYTLRTLTRTKAIAALKDLDIKYVSIKDFHAKMKDGTPTEWAAARKEFEDAGLTIASGGNITFKSEKEDDIKFNFEYAKAMGFPVIVMAPALKNLPMIEKYCKQYNIKAAIHNHGPEDKDFFPTPQSVLKEVKNMDSRMGLCIDVGHTVRTGVDLLESIQMAGSRLHDMHVKDLKDFTKKESQCIVGYGAMPITKVFRLLKKMKYTGGVMLEYEISPNDPVPGMRESISYLRGVINALTVV